MKNFDHIKPAFEIDEQVIYCGDFDLDLEGGKSVRREVNAVVLQRCQYSSDGAWGYSVRLEDGLVLGLHLCELKKAA
jgi:hypothetical protein